MSQVRYCQQNNLMERVQYYCKKMRSFLHQSDHTVRDLSEHHKVGQ